MPLRLRARVWRHDASCSFDAAEAFCSLPVTELESFLNGDDSLREKLFYLSLPYNSELQKFLDFSLSHPESEKLIVDFSCNDAADILRQTRGKAFAAHWLKACDKRVASLPGAWHSWIIEETGMRAKTREMGGYMVPVYFLDGDPRRLADIMRRYAIPGEMPLVDKKGGAWLVSMQGYVPCEKPSVKLKIHI